MTIGDVGGADSDRSEIGEEGGFDGAVDAGGTPGRVNAALPDPVWVNPSSSPSEAGSSAFCMED
jgi:hypothetical protein